MSKDRIQCELHITEDMILWAILRLRVRPNLGGHAIKAYIRAQCEMELAEGFFTGATDTDIMTYLSENDGEISEKAREMAARIASDLGVTA